MRMGTTMAATGVAGPAAPGGLLVVGADGACTRVCVCVCVCVCVRIEEGTWERWGGVGTSHWYYTLTYEGNIGVWAMLVSY